MTMSLPIILRAVLSQLQMSAGIYNSRLKNLAAKKQSVILMYHRVISPSKADEYIEPGMYVTPETFKMHMKLLPKYFDVISLQKLYEMPDNELNKPRCAITFDDGWLDFYTNAYPILQNNKLPATVFLPTSFTGTEQWFWTDRLANILKSYTFSPLKSSPDNLSSKIAYLHGSLFSRIDAALKLLKPHSLEEINKVLDELERNCRSNRTIQKRAFLDWNECRAIKKNSLITFGSHTANHIILTSENDEMCRKELDISKRKLIDEEVVDPSFISFCYPNGGFSEISMRIVEESGYHCAVTTKNGWVDANNNRFSLKRVGVHQDMASTMALMLARIAR